MFVGQFDSSTRKRTNANEERNPPLVPLPPSVYNSRNGRSSMIAVPWLGNEIELPAILYIPGVNKQFDDPNDLCYRLPELADAIARARGAETSQSGSGSRSSDRQPHFHVVFTTEDGQALAWPVMSCGRDPATTFSLLRPQIKNRIIPLTEADYATVPNIHPWCPAGRIVEFLVPTSDLKDTPILNGYLVTAAQLLFPLENLMYYPTRSAKIHPLQLKAIHGYLTMLQYEELLESEEGGGPAGAEGGDSLGAEGGGSGRGGRGRPRGGGGGSRELKGSRSGRSGAGIRVNDGEVDSDTLEELYFLASAGGPGGAEFLRVAKQLGEQDRRARHQRALDGQQRLLDYRMNVAEAQADGTLMSPEEVDIPADAAEETAPGSDFEEGEPPED